MYSYLEPDFETLILNVTLIREGNRRTEQIFAVGITVSDPAVGRAATLDEGDFGINYDFRLTAPGAFVTLIFPPVVNSIVFHFFINSDELPEGLEAFQASSVPVAGFPNFQSPVTNTAFQNTEIQIMDNDCKLVLR